MKSFDWMSSVMCAAAAMPKFERELCLLDTVIGDGDHGVTIRRGYESTLAGVQLSADTTIEEFCTSYATVISDSMGGAIGPIYGLMWRSMGKALSGKSEIAAIDMAQALLAASERIGIVGKVKAGDKTMLDALVPAAEALMNAAGLPLTDAKFVSAEAANQGSENTRTMIAKKGRARYLQEKSIGHVDAGARSFSLWMMELSECMKKRGEALT